MKDRIFHCLDANTIQQYKFRKPDYPFRQNQQAQQQQNQYHHVHNQQLATKNHQMISNSGAVANTSSSVSASSIAKARYHTVTDPSVSSRATPSNSYFGSSTATSSSTIQSQYHQPSNPSFMPSTNVINQPPTPNMYGLNRSKTPTIPSIGQMMPQSAAQPFQPVVNPMSQTSTAQSGHPPAIFTPQTTNQLNINQTTAPAMPSYMHMKPATAWNDPPIVAPKIKVKILQLN
jgi:hypothetical protein